MSAGDSEGHGLAILRPEEADKRGGMPLEAIIGIWYGDEPSPDRFTPNLYFVDFMHDVIKSAGPTDPSLLATASQQQEGWLFVFDHRQQGDTPTEDIIGAFEIRQGMIVADTYWRNDDHVVFSEKGPVQLPPTLQQVMVERARALPNR